MLKEASNPRENFTRFTIIMNLWKQDRKNGATAAWRELPENFRSALQDLTLAVAEHGDSFPYRSVTLDCEFGVFMLSKDRSIVDNISVVTFDDLLSILPNLVDSCDDRNSC
jgi:hypothetical protein